MSFPRPVLSLLSPHLARVWLVFGLGGALPANEPTPHAAGHGPTEGSGGIVLMTEERQDLTSPTQAYEWLAAGNERFRTGKTLAKDLVAQREVVAAHQYPFASILSCMDSRTSSELIFDANLGDLFNVRIAGNVVTDDVLGSLEYAHKVAGAKLLVVLGHSHCGAIKGAANDVVMGNLTGLLARLRPALAAIPNDDKPRNGKNLEFVDRAARMHVILMVRLIRERSPILRELQDRGVIDVLGAFYDLETGRVEFYRPLSGAGPVRTSTQVVSGKTHADLRAEAGKEKVDAPAEGHAPEGHEAPTEKAAEAHDKPPAEPGHAEPAHAEPASGHGHAH